ncbi:MAG TPA: hypothetical protein VGL58_10465 [Caulobacteraceae bacterium]|jgi:hypothetical protein
MEPAPERPIARWVRLRGITTTAFWIDQWLRDHVGRAYTAILAIGLVLGISESFNSIAGSFGGGHRFDLARDTVVVLFQAGLLINQLAQVHLWRMEQRARRAERQREKEGRPAP